MIVRGLLIAVMAGVMAAAVRADDVPTATLITLDVVDAGPEEVLPQIIEQMGGRLTVSLENLYLQRKVWPRATFDFEQAPFWLVMREVCNTYGLRLSEPRMQGDPLHVTEGTPGVFKAPFVLDGPFLVSLQSVDHARSVDMTQDGRVTGRSSISLNVMIEPKVQVIAVQWSPLVETALDENGVSLAPEQHRSRNHSGGGGMRVFETRIQLLPRAADAKTLKLLKGKIELTVKTESEKLEVGDILNVKDAAYTVGGAAITIREMKETLANTYELKLTYDEPDRRDQMDRWDEKIKALRILDAEGRSLLLSDYGGLGGGEGMAYSIRVERENGRQTAGPPAKLVWEVTTGTQEIEVPFEFRDVPLN